MEWYQRCHKPLSETVFANSQMDIYIYVNLPKWVKWVSKKGCDVLLSSKYRWRPNMFFKGNPFKMLIFMSDNVACFRCKFANIGSLVRTETFLHSCWYDLQFIWSYIFLLEINPLSIYVDMICCLLRSTSPKGGPSLVLGDVYWITMSNEHGTCHICQTNEQAIYILSDLVAFVWAVYMNMYLMVE